MNTEDVRNHDRRFSGDPPRKLTFLKGSHQESGEMKVIPQLVCRHTLHSSKVMNIATEDTSRSLVLFQSGRIMSENVTESPDGWIRTGKAPRPGPDVQLTRNRSPLLRMVPRAKIRAVPQAVHPRF